MCVFAGTFINLLAVTVFFHQKCLTTTSKKSSNADLSNPSLALGVECLKQFESRVTSGVAGG